MGKAAGLGTGVLGVNEPGPQKTERDKRAPAGVFKIGKIYTYDPALPEGAKYPFHTITEADAWIDDPTLPHYNQHVVIDPKNPPPWFEKQKMRLNDPPHRWLIEIRHNADPPVPVPAALFSSHPEGPESLLGRMQVMPESSFGTSSAGFERRRIPIMSSFRVMNTRRWQAWGLPLPQAAAALLGP